MNGDTPSRNSGSPEERPPAVSFDGIEKGFFGVPVLKRVRFSARAGRITGLVGENGAGKSTLMNLLGGNLQPDSGQLQVNGLPYAPRSPGDARAAGIAFVHQELNLFPNLSIAENLFLTEFPRAVGGLPWIDRRKLRDRARHLLDQVDLSHDPDTPVERLPPGERQLLEIARALGAQAHLLLLDEPTTSLSVRECARLFDLMHRLRTRGIAMIYISHALGDVLKHCDDLVVLRDGEVVGHGPAGEFTQGRLVSLMVGRELNQLYPVRTPPPAPDESGSRTPQLEVRGLTQPGKVRDISFRLAPGEILGVAGLMGAGRSELARILFGLDPHTSGDIRIGGHPLEGGPRHRIRQGLAFLTEDRRHEGLCLEASVADNLALVTLEEHAQTPARWLDLPGIGAAVARIRDALQISTRVTDAQPVRTLSGGNQQKVVLGKWLLSEPRVLILDEPTRGIDVGARFEIYQWIHRLADRGSGILVISSEIEELIGLCDRILVMRRGELSGEFPRGKFDREQILAAALHTSTS